MTSKEYAEKSRMVLASYVAELDAMETAVTRAATTGGNVPQASHLFETMSDAAQESGKLLEFYEGETIPIEVHDAMVHVQRAITDLAAALKLHIILQPRPKGK